MFYYENQASQLGFRLVIGIDEAGRGPLAGPVVASAVSLKTRRFQSRIRDSKKMPAVQREEAFHEICEKAHFGIGIINESIIDSINILQATQLAMSIAVKQLINKLPVEETSQENFIKQVCLLIDGNYFRSDLPYSYKTIIDGDNLSRSVSCASIIAKVTRDRILNVYDRVFPNYGFKNHKGYGTESHRVAIKTHGLSPIHRKTFNFLEPWTTETEEIGL